MSGHRLDFQLGKRLLAYLKPWKSLIWIAVIFIVLARAIDALVPLFMGYMAQEILSGKNESFSLVMKGGAWLIALLIGGYVMDLINLAIRSWVGSNALLKLRMDVFSHIQKLPVKTFDTEPIGRLMTRTMNDVDQINQMFSESVVPIAGNLILFLIIFSMLFFLDYRIGLIILFITPFMLYLTNYFRVIQRKCYNSIRRIVAEVNSFVQEHLAGVVTVRHFGLRDQEMKKFDKLNDELSDRYKDSVENFGFFISGNDFLQSTALISAFVVLMRMPPFEAGTFFTFTLYVMMIFRPLSDLAERYNVLQSAFAASERIFHTLDTPIEKSSGEILNEIGEIVFEDVWFAYKNEEWVLKGVSFTIRKGESVALVGQTGSGKTTVISLLLRFYDYQKGRILVNGKEIRTYSLESTRHAFSIVLQDPVLFSGTIKENVSLFDTSISDKDVEKSLAYVNFTAYPPSTLLLERGKSLSSGQMQLLSLARAVAHPGRFLILDEATANIDPITEDVIQKTLEKILQGRGAIVIAHRLSTIKDVNRIFVLSHGQLVEGGTHEELMAQKGVYEKLYRLQYL